MIIRISLAINFIFLIVLGVSAQSLTEAKLADIIVDGTVLANPFAGGLNAPQISNADLNNDGTEDILIFDRIGDAILPMLNTEEGYIYDPSYAENFPALEHFALMIDYNSDGISDIFCYSQSPGISGATVFKGKYTNNKLDFDIVLDQNGNFPEVLNFRLANGSFANIAILDTDIPSIEDIDGDGDMDIVTFNFLGGYVEFYKNLVVERNESIDGFYFVKEEDCYGGIYESGFSQEISLPDFPGDCSEGFNDNEVSTRHAGSTVLNIDFDADGDFELLLGDLSFSNITLLENGGDAENAFFNRQIISYPDEAEQAIDIPIFPGVFYADADGDGIKDLLAAPNNINNSLDVDNIWFYKNQGLDNEPIFELASKSIFSEDMLDLGTGSFPAFADVNGDGLQDMIVGTNTTYLPGGDRDGRLYLFTNVGTATEPSFELTDDNWLDFQRFNNGAYRFSPSFADVDSDGDLDLYVGERQGFIYYAENMAGPNAPMEFGPITPNYLDLDIGQNAAPHFYDLDQDGLLDLLIGERNGNVNFVKNIGTSTNPNFDLESTENVEVLGRIDTRHPTTVTGNSTPRIVNTASGTFLITGTTLGVMEMYRVDADFNSTWELVDADFGNIKVGGETSPAIVDLNNDGIQEVIIGNLRGGLNSFTGLETTPLSTFSASTKNDLQLRSNISVDYIELAENQAADIRVYSMLGQLLLTERNQNKADISALGSGIYLVELQRENVRNTVKVFKPY